VVTTLTYDLRQRLTSRSTAGETTSFQYDPVGSLTRLTQPDGSYVSYTYDGARRLTEVADNQGNRIAYTLDAAGNRTREEVFDPQGALAKTLTRAYDALGRMQTLTGVGNE
jgi:YD repeat-containing protein